jgi:hypothetical protein
VARHDRRHGFSSAYADQQFAIAFRIGAARDDAREEISRVD